MNETNEPQNGVDGGQATSRRTVMIGAITTAASLVTMPAGSIEAEANVTSGSVDFRNSDTAVVLIDPQNDVLSEKGVNWGAVGASVTENRTVENIEQLLRAARAHGYQVFISPHYFYPTDYDWKFNGPLETSEIKTHSFARRGPLIVEGLAGSGADWLERFQIAVVKDATAGPRHPQWGDGYQAALINFRFLAHEVLSTREVVERMR